MALSKDDILNAVADMSVMDIVSLIEAMEEKFGVSAAAAVAAAPVATSSPMMMRGRGERAPFRQLQSAQHHRWTITITITMARVVVVHMAHAVAAQNVGERGWLPQAPPAAGCPPHRCSNSHSD